MKRRANQKLTAASLGPGKRESSSKYSRLRLRMQMYPNSIGMAKIRDSYDRIPTLIAIFSYGKRKFIAKITGNIDALIASEGDVGLCTHSRQRALS